MVRVDLFIDALCVWAWVSGVRVREIQERFGGQVEIRWHTLNLFGCTAARIGEGWAERGGYEGFSDHIRKVCEGFDHVQPSADIWCKVRPCSSMPAHLWLKAAEQVSRQQGGRIATTELVGAVQDAFFARGLDISQEVVLEKLMAEQGLDVAALRRQRATGEPAADLARDLTLADQYRLRGSPSYVLNEGRQILFGNVGYRIIEANLQEILNRPGDIATWC